MPTCVCGEEYGEGHEFCQFDSSAPPSSERPTDPAPPPDTVSTWPAPPGNGEWPEIRSLLADLQKFTDNIPAIDYEFPFGP
jgi:hypothetical protein